jgi:hypothetical protein
MADQRGVVNLQLIQKIKNIAGKISAQKACGGMIGEPMAAQRDGIDAVAPGQQRKNAIVGVPRIARAMEEDNHRPLGVALYNIVERDAAFKLNQVRREHAALLGLKKLLRQEAESAQPDEKQQGRKPVPEESQLHCMLLVSNLEKWLISQPR